ncbi:uncharacterized protein LOC131673900 isoform X1 [Phymastichus coffea]|uniref:uncharacterized protein LOC131673900 isoform X1 n=1 Tax=Phymastichus coffea TaxID=108790 RepID=UPI00273C1508|nr:uncharacterized protein LOC131673900 isoform X1 [Phymastichus coffea]
MKGRQANASNYATARALLWLISCALCAATPSDDMEARCFENEDCYQLKRTMVSEVTASVDPCVDVHSYMCSRRDRSDEGVPLQRRLSGMAAYLITTLDGPPQEDDNDLLKVEKQLYKSCIQLGNARGEAARSQQLKTQIENLGGLALWQDVDYVAFSSALGSSFFEVKVGPHPTDEARSAILVMKRAARRNRRAAQVRTRRGLLAAAAAVAGEDEGSARPGEEGRGLQAAAAQEPLLRAGARDRGPLRVRARGRGARRAWVLRGAAAGQTRVDDGRDEPARPCPALRDARTTARRRGRPGAGRRAAPSRGWRGTDAGLSRAQVGWIELVRRLLQSRNLDLDTDDVVLQSPAYFARLTELLRDTPNEVVVAAIQTKALTDNLAYVDWERAALLDRIDRVDFCLRETRLYGASRRLVRDWLSKDDDRRGSYRMGQSIFTSVVSAVRRELSLYALKSPSDVHYYKAKLLRAIENLDKYVYDSPYNLYEALNITGNYFDDIVQYRKLLTNEDLERLRRNSGSSEPFSFIDQGEAQNRFVIQTLINTAEMLSPHLPKEVHYGTFGVKTAALIHSLLHEDTYNDDLASESTEKLVYPKYPVDVKSCVRQNLRFHYSADRADDVVTQNLAVNTAYEALTRDQYTMFHDVSNSYLIYNNITRDKLFFMAYVKGNCALDSAIVNGILSDDRAFDRAFHCEMNVIGSDNTTCVLGKVDS